MMSKVEVDGVSIANALSRSRELFSQLKFDYLELETKQGFLEHIGNIEDRKPIQEEDIQLLGMNAAHTHTYMHIHHAHICARVYIFT